MPSIFSSDWRNEVNAELAGKQPLDATLSQLANTGTLNLFGGQIIFPATQVPSANPNTLDDYEEGTWTPTLDFGGGSTGITYGSVLSTYTKVGRGVLASFDFTLTSKGTSTGIAQILGWPFAGVGGNASGVVSLYQNMAGIAAAITFNMSSVTAVLRQSSGAATVVSLNDTNFTNTARLIGGIVYATT